MSWQSCELELDSVDFIAMQGGGVRAYREYVRRRQRSSAKKDTLVKLRFNLVKTLGYLFNKIWEWNSMQVKVINHPLIQHKLTLIRDKNTGPKEFRELLEEVAMLMGYELTRDLPLEEIEIETPVTKCTCKTLSGKKIGIVPILRAGLGMVSGFLRLIPAAKVGHVGVYRDPQTLKPVEYYCKLPTDVAERDFVVIDPMLATGGSSVAAISLLKQKGAKNIKLMCLVAAPEGIHLVNEQHPDVEVYTASVDERLNDHGYIVPGLGDAGDRIFGTK